MARYCNNYDNLKGNEPHFDAYLACIAISQDKSIYYYPMQFHDEHENDKPYVTKFRTNVLDPMTREPYSVGVCRPGPGYTRNYAFNGEYNNAYHIFILAPLSPASLEDIKKKISTNLKHYDIVIHMQGEAVNSEPITNKDDGSETQIMTCQQICQSLSRMTPAGTGKGMFGEAFNLCSGSKQASELRNYLKEELGAVLYSVQILSPKPVSIETQKGDIVDIPPILRDATEYILKMIELYPKPDDPSPQPPYQTFPMLFH